MKKLAILLGTLAIAASAFAGGKEVVPDPASPTVIKEVEKVVYRDRTDIGSVTFRYQIMGAAGAYSKDGFKSYRENGYSGDFGRLRIDGSIKLTDRVKFGFQVRSDRELGFSDKDNNRRVSSRFRAWFDYKHDLLGATSRLWYQDTGAYVGTYDIPGSQNLDYKFLIPVAEYFFDNDFIKTTTFDIGPQIGYSWNHSDDVGGGHSYTGDASYYGGLAIYTNHKLPWNFSLEANVYALYIKTNSDYYGFDKGDKNNFFVYTEVYLRNKTKLVDLGDSSTLSFVFEGGYDPYRWSQHKDYINRWGDIERSTYSLYALPTLRVDYKATSNIDIFVEAGAELRNGADIFEAKSTAQGWKWAPFAQTGFTVKF